jgi:hypothetical protein
MVAIALMVMASPAVAAERQPVTITATTMFLVDSDNFTATGLPGCASGTVVDGKNMVRFTPFGGIYAGYKIFTCTDNVNGFILRLNAHFGVEGLASTWAVVDSWGSLGWMHGAGKLYGVGITDGVIDNYVGTVASKAR